jgi:hypothetical protein
MTSPRLSIGKALLTLGALYTPVGAFVMDWSETHLFNPRWSGHAKFHDAQTMSLSAECAALSLWQLWRPGPDDRARLHRTLLFASLFVASQVPAPLFPHTTWADQESPIQPTSRAGIPINQLTIETAILTPLLLGGYLLERRRLDRAGRTPITA